MRTAPFSLQADERLLGRWPMRYLPPWGGRYEGVLEVTDRRVRFTACLLSRASLVEGTDPAGPQALAEVLDLDANQVVCTGDRLLISIAKADIECVRSERSFVRSRIGLTIRDNGSMQVFENGVGSVVPVLNAIRRACGG